MCIYVIIKIAQLVTYDDAIEFGLRVFNVSPRPTLFRIRPFSRTRSLHGVLYIAVHLIQQDFSNRKHIHTIQLTTSQAML